MKSSFHLFQNTNPKCQPRNILNYIHILILAMLHTTHIECKIPSITLSQQNHYVVLYTNASSSASGQIPDKLNFLIDFTINQFVMDNKYEGICLFVDNHPKTRTDNKCLTKHMHVKYQNFDTNKNTPSSQLDNQQQDDNDDSKQTDNKISGIIGLKNNSQFSKSLRTALNLHDLKYYFKISEYRIQLVNESCHSPIFPPYIIKAQTQSSSSINIQQFVVEHAQLSMVNVAVKPMLKLLNKKTNPFTITHEQFLDTKINLDFRNQNQFMPLRYLIEKKCLRVVGSRNYECDLEKNRVKTPQYMPNKSNNPQQSMGFLLFEFDPIICSTYNAIELPQTAKIGSEAYYWGHIFLIIMQLCLLLIFKNRIFILDRLQSIIKTSKKYDRNL